MTAISIFEDDASSNFYPLTYTRPVCELVCGTATLREKLLSVYGGCSYSIICRPVLAGVVDNLLPGVQVNTVLRNDVLFINGRLLPDTDLADRIPLHGEEAVYFCGDTLVAARLSGDRASRLEGGMPPEISALLTIKRIEVEVKLVTYPWDLIHMNGGQLMRDIPARDRRLFARIDTLKGVSCLDGGNIFISPAATVKPGTVLDAEPGPILIGAGAVIGANTVIEGPVSIGEGTHIKAGARISGGTTIGPVCKVGGEVEGSIIIGFSNKQHDGYLGHSCLGCWVNLGAGTTNSDLKNNYHSVKMTINGNSVDTGSLFVGLIMGDHSKTGIGTILNTGTVAGVCCNIFDAGFPPTYIPSFSWCGSGRIQTYDPDKALETARTVMDRRGRVLSKEEEAVLRNVYQATEEERKRVLSD